LECFDGCGFDVLGRVEIRFPGAETADVDSLRFHRLCFAVDRQRERRSHLSCAFGNFHLSIFVSNLGSAHYLCAQKFSIKALKLFSSTPTIAISRFAFSIESDACAALIMIVWPNSLRIEPGGAFAGSVGPR